jgi:hypothetical protein
MALFEPIFAALNENHVRYVVVGGLATVLHGFARLTADIDLIVDLAPDEARRAVTTLVGLGFRPRVPVEALDLADPEIRRKWIDEKGMRVLSFWDPAQPMRELDLFVEHPIDFELLWAHAEIVHVRGALVRIASIPDLIALKRLAGRAEDVIDIRALQEIQQRKGPRS